MAEVSTEAVTLQTDEGDFAFDAGHPEGHTGDDFDFDLGADEGKVEDHGVIISDHDEIGYEDESHVPVAESAGTTGEYGSPQHFEETTAPEHADDGDEIDYEDADLGATTHTDSQGITEQGAYETAAAHNTDQPNDDIDFGFDTEEATAAETHGDAEDEDEEVEEVEDATEENDQEDEEEDDDDEDADDDDDEDNGPETVEIDDDESDESVHDYGDEDDSGDSPGFGDIDSLEPVYTTDVTVTWGDEVCPLFKSSEGADPDSFYLEDEEALDFPLSRFLQTIRGNIESYLNKGDEIFIRLEELGFEFGETTTEALLNQVTFHNLLALHSTLVKNEAASESNGVHITLGTRPNCLLRLKDLVGGASTGKGLSAFQKAAHNSPDDSSNEGDDIAAGSDESSANDDEEEEEEEADEEDEGEAPVPEADLEMLDTTGNADAVDLGLGDDVPTAEGGAEGDDLDFIDFHDDEMTGGAPLDDTAHAVVTLDETEQLQNTDDLGLIDGNEHHELNLSAVPENLVHDDLDLLVDLDDTAGQNQDDQRLVTLEPENGIELTDDGHQHDGQAEPEGDQDDFVNLHDDADDTADLLAVEAPNGDKAEVEASLGTSVTATLDNDEIDYEDVETGASGIGGTEPTPNQDVTNPSEATPAAGEAPAAPETAADTGLDEIDWDDEVKNHVPSEATSTPVTGKRVREAGQEQDAELLGELPDTKRHRTGDAAS